MEKISPEQQRRVWSRVLAQNDAAAQEVSAADEERVQSGRFAQKVLAAIRAQCEDLALYRYMMRKLCSAAVMQLKTLAAHSEARLKTLGAVYYLETGEKACTERQGQVCVACPNEALRQQFARIGAQAEAYRALGEEKAAYACRMQQLAGQLECDKQLVLEILQENL